jgi:hypothetical protein
MAADAPFDQIVAPELDDIPDVLKLRMALVGASIYTHKHAHIHTTRLRTPFLGFYVAHVHFFVFICMFVSPWRTETPRTS